MYYFIEAKNKYTYNYLKNKYGHSESSDISKIEGWVLEDNEMKLLPKELNYIIRNIPNNYQTDINEFKTDYWDGEFSFE